MLVTERKEEKRGGEERVEEKQGEDVEKTRGARFKHLQN